MMEKTHLWPQEIAESDGVVTASVIIEHPKHGSKRLWYRVPVEHKSTLTKGCNPFVLGTIFKAMRESTDLIVHGEVSPSLLRNLEEFQAAWACWRPERYAKIEIIADTEREPQRNSNSDKTIVAFSGGVDSVFTVWRHRTGRCGRLKRDLQAGLMVHGFDIPLDQRDVFNRAAEKSAKMLTSQNMKLISLATNFKNLGDDWEDAFAAATASCLMMLEGGYSVGLFGSSEPYHSLVLPWGSNPVTDGMLSSDTFQIIHDGAAFTRNEKVREIANWPEALQYLRVCWQGAQKDRNCGYCEKCIRTILNFRVMGVDLPQCFEQDVSDSQIVRISRLNAAQIAEYTQILSAAKTASISKSWVKAVDMCLRLNRLRLKARQIPVMRWLYQFAIR